MQRPDPRKELEARLDRHARQQYAFWAGARTAVQITLPFLVSVVVYQNTRNAWYAAAAATYAPLRLIPKPRMRFGKDYLGKDF